MCYCTLQHGYSFGAVRGHTPPWESKPNSGSRTGKTAGCTHKWCLTANPMINNGHDLVGSLSLLWKPEWAETEESPISMFGFPGSATGA